MCFLCERERGRERRGRQGDTFVSFKPLTTYEWGQLVVLFIYGVVVQCFSNFFSDILNFTNLRDLTSIVIICKI